MEAESSEIPTSGEWVKASACASESDRLKSVPLDQSSSTRRALIVDTRAVLGTEVCRSLYRMGWQVDIFAEPGSPAFRSRTCHRRLCYQRGRSAPAFLAELDAIVESGDYKAVYLCSEEILELLVTSGNSSRWQSLLLSQPSSLKTTLSKNAMVRLAEAAEVPVPRTLVPARETELERAAKELGFPLVIKGDRGEATRNVRITRRPDDLARLYREVTSNELDYDGRPALQEFIPGAQYSVGGLFHNGRPLRVCAYRKILTYPLNGGLSAKTVTERPATLLKAAFALFAELHYTGLGQMQFIRDARDGRFKFLEINPRVWGCIGLAQHAGVDLYTPYADLANGKVVEPNLEYQVGVNYHRFSVEMRLMLERPWQLPRFLKDCFDPRVYSDFYWRDPGPHLPSIHALRRLLRSRVRPGPTRWFRSSDIRAT
jgi:predicted ATP-grasp superfamily ATP-dependent carboligase